MSDVTDGGPAFPMPIGYAHHTERTGHGIYNDPQHGMSLRDWFAGVVTVGEEDFPAGMADSIREIELKCEGEASDAVIKLRAALEARIRYAKADSMLKVREIGK